MAEGGNGEAATKAKEEIEKGVKWTEKVGGNHR